MIPKYTAAFVAITASLLSCYSSAIPLSEKEAELENALSRQYSGKAVLSHDSRAVRENRQDGTFIIYIENGYDSLCCKSSSYLQKIAGQTARQAYGTIAHSRNYSRFEVSFFSTERTGENSYFTSCTKTITIDIPGFINGKITEEHITPQKKVSSDEIIE